MEKVEHSHLSDAIIISTLRLIKYKRVRIRQSIFVYQLIFYELNCSFSFTDIKKAFGQSVSDVVLRVHISISIWCVFSNQFF